MPAITPFRAKRSRRRAVSMPLFPAEVRPFPLVRHAGSVDRLAQHLRSLWTAKQQRDAMLSFIEAEWERLCELGADKKAAEDALIDFSHAVWAKVAGSYERGGVA